MIDDHILGLHQLGLTPPSHLASRQRLVLEVLIAPEVQAYTERETPLGQVASKQHNVVLILLELRVHILSHSLELLQFLVLADPLDSSKLRLHALGLPQVAFFTYLRLLSSQGQVAGLVYEALDQSALPLVSDGLSEHRPLPLRIHFCHPLLELIQRLGHLG